MRCYIYGNRYRVVGVHCYDDGIRVELERNGMVYDLVFGEPEFEWMLNMQPMPWRAVNLGKALQRFIKHLCPYWYKQIRASLKENQVHQ